MNLALWVATVILALVFLLSAAVKGTQSSERAVKLGMTGVVDIPVPLMRFVALCEVLGVIGLFVPHLTRIQPWLTPVAALGLGAIMVLAARIHLRLGEPGTAAGNMVLLALSLFVAWGRIP